MAARRRKHPFWRRNDPAAKFDIAKLRPKPLPRGDRFETLNDVRRESARSEELLDAYRRNNGLSVFLKECRGGHYHCEKPFCPQCARTFRRWLIAEFLRLNSSFREPVTIFTVLLESAPPDNLLDLNIENYRHSLRKRLDRTGLGACPGPRTASARHGARHSTRLALATFTSTTLEEPR